MFDTVCTYVHYMFSWRYNAWCFVINGFHKGSAWCSHMKPCTVSRLQLLLATLIGNASVCDPVLHEFGLMLCAHTKRDACAQYWFWYILQTLIYHNYYDCRWLAPYISRSDSDSLIAHVTSNATSILITWIASKVQSACMAMPVSIPSDAGPAETFQELLFGASAFHGTRISMFRAEVGLVNGESWELTGNLPQWS